MFSDKNRAFYVYLYIVSVFTIYVLLLSIVMPESRTNLNPKPKTSSPYWVGLLLRYSTFGAAIFLLLAGLY